MKNQFYYLVYHVLAVFLSIFLCAACEMSSSNKTNDESEVTSVIPAPIPSDVAFFHAWLADCVNDLSYKSNDPKGAAFSIKNIATRKIRGAIGNSILQNKFGRSNQILAWGPELTVSAKDTNVIVDNLMYTLRSTSNDTVFFNIGISGTNMISIYDWFTEDFNAKDQKPYGSSGSTKGYISEGTHIGLQALLSLTDTLSHNNIRLLQYLGNETASSDTIYQVTVSGHSLGGALAPVYALQLKESFTSKSNVFVEAHSFAGPSIGDSTFNSYLTGTLDHFSPINNSLDVIPHAWNLGSLHQLCNIYKDYHLKCSGQNYQAGGAAAKGVIAWLTSQSNNALHPYVTLGSPTDFPGTLVDSIACYEIIGINTYLSLKYSEVFTLINTSIPGKCGGGPLDYFSFFMYMYQMAYQHTSGYTNHFFPDPGLQKAVNKYVSVPHTPDEMITILKEYGIPIFKKLLTDTNNYLEHQHNLGHCDCPTTTE